MKRHGAVPKLSASSKALVLLLPLVLLAFIFFFFVSPKEMMSACSSPPAVPRKKPDFRLLIGVPTRADLYERRHLLRMHEVNQSTEI
ncbi:hypothetical protein EJB05_51418, partial [Eragrostis curvula]